MTGAAVDPRELDAVAAELRAARRVTVLTGAGVSAASGVPTFRGDGGLYKNVRAEELATPEGFARDPQVAWEWYAMRRARVAACRPNAAHEVLADWERRLPGFQLVTQNVDGLHERAGSETLLRLHGSLQDVGCWDSCPGSPHRWRDARTEFETLPPPCPHCGGILRPGVVWFGETLDMAVFEAAARAARCDVCLIVGTSSLVYPAAGLAELAAAHCAVVVEVNPESTQASGGCDHVLAGPAEQVLPALDARLQGA